MSRSAASNLQSTPSSRINADMGLSDRAKQRVRNASGNSRCIVENCVESKAVQFCHCYPRKMSYKGHEQTLDKIEWYWNMQHRTLNLDTRFNIFRAGASLHYLFDQNHWFLLPEERIVDQYYQSLTVTETGPSSVAVRAHRNSFPIIEGDRFEYRFIPLSPEMVDIPLIRQDDSMPPTKNGISIHLHPFSDIPPLESHLHPKFVILNVGSKLAPKPEIVKPLSQMIHNPTILSRILDIYTAWNFNPPENYQNDKTFNFQEDPDDESHQGDDQSDRTAFRRVPDPTTRKRAWQTESPTPAPIQGGRGQQTLKRAPSICLSKNSVELHDKRAGDKKWTDDALRDWSKQCHPLSETVHALWNPKLAFDRTIPSM